CDGWLPLYYSPYRQEVYADQIKDRKPGFEIMQGVSINITDDIEAGLLPVKQNLAFYVGGMGAQKANFHTELISRMGLEAEARKIQELFLAGKRDEAVQVVPSEFADEISLVGPVERIRDRLKAWEDSPVTSLLVNAPADPAKLRDYAELVLG
ncbi:MAG: LLM class flavin-dependent oxidoreductase, partial [Pseudomonadota bacterium]